MTIKELPRTAPHRSTCALVSVCGNVFLENGWKHIVKYMISVHSYKRSHMVAGNSQEFNVDNGHFERPCIAKAGSNSHFELPHSSQARELFRTSPRHQGRLEKPFAANSNTSLSKGSHRKHIRRVYKRTETVVVDSIRLSDPKVTPK